MRLRYFDEWLRNVHAGVIHQYVEPLESIDLGTKSFTVGYVADEDFRAPASLGDVLLKFFKFALRSANQKHLGSCLSQSKGGHGAKAAAGAGHQRNAAIQPEGSREDWGIRYRGYGVSPELATRPTSRPA